MVLFIVFGSCNNQTHLSNQKNNNLSKQTQKNLFSDVAASLLKRGGLRVKRVGGRGKKGAREKETRGGGVEGERWRESVRRIVLGETGLLPHSQEQIPSTNHTEQQAGAFTRALCFSLRLLCVVFLFFFFFFFFFLLLSRTPPFISTSTPTPLYTLHSSLFPPQRRKAAPTQPSFPWGVQIPPLVSIFLRYPTSHPSICFTLKQQSKCLIRSSFSSPLHTPPPPHVAETTNKASSK